MDSKNGFAVLTNSKGKIVDKVEYKNLPNGIGYIKENGKFLQNNSIKIPQDGISGEILLVLTEKR